MFRATATIAVHSDHAAISGVTEAPWMPCLPAAPCVYVVVPQQATPLAALSALLEAEAELVLIARSGRAAGD